MSHLEIAKLRFQMLQEQQAGGTWPRCHGALDPAEMKQVFADSGNYFYEGNVQKVSQERNKNEGIGTFPLVHIISYSCNCLSTIDNTLMSAIQFQIHTYIIRKKLYLLQGNNILSIIVSSFSLFIITLYMSAEQQAKDACRVDPALQKLLACMPSCSQLLTCQAA